MKKQKVPITSIFFLNIFWLLIEILALIAPIYFEFITLPIQIGIFCSIFLFQYLSISKILRTWDKKNTEVKIDIEKQRNLQNLYQSLKELNWSGFLNQCRDLHVTNSARELLNISALPSKQFCTVTSPKYILKISGYNLNDINILQVASQSTFNLGEQSKEFTELLHDMLMEMRSFYSNLIIDTKSSISEFEDLCFSGQFLDIFLKHQKFASLFSDKEFKIQSSLKSFQIIKKDPPILQLKINKKRKSFKICLKKKGKDTPFSNKYTFSNFGELKGKDLEKLKNEYIQVLSDFFNQLHPTITKN